MRLPRLTLLLGALLLASCGGGGTPDDSGCSGRCQTDNPQRLEPADVMQVVAQAVDEARARGALATIAVTDRVGNVLAVFRMTGANQAVRVGSNPNPGGAGTGLDGLTIPAGAGSDRLAAIAKAITGAYLSSEGNAFSTRTASQIVQEHFNPRENDQPGGPLFGVQFSQLPCSDLSLRFGSAPSATAGPKRSPLGLSADSGGFPLYKAGQVVGGVGVIADGLYNADPDISDNDRDIDELIAIAATAGFDAPQDRRANRITAGGLSLRYSDVGVGQTTTGGRSTLTFAQASALGALVPVPGYYAGAAVLQGTFFGAPASGYQPTTVPAFADLDAFELVNGAPRFPPIGGTDGLLTQAEVTQILRSAILNANRLRAQIRRPVGSQMRGTVSVVDTSGAILGVLRTRDAPVFGTDVSLQKARSALFFSSPTLGANLNAAGSVRYFIPDLGTQTAPVSFGDYATAMSAQLSPETLLGDFAFGARSIGNVARPFFPDGLDGNPPGALSKPLAGWSPFSTGLQLDLVYERIIQHVGFVAGLPGIPDVGGSCSGPPAPAFGFATTVPAQLGNGLQIFAGGVPIYRGNTIIGAIGVSGDGIDQDDLVAFLGVDNAAGVLGTFNNAPPALRIDRLDVPGGRLRYVQCPQAPFLDTDTQNVCQGK